MTKKTKQNKRESAKAAPAMAIFVPIASIEPFNPQADHVNLFDAASERLLLQGSAKFNFGPFGRRDQAISID